MNRSPRWSSQHSRQRNRPFIDRDTYSTLYFFSMFHTTHKCITAHPTVATSYPLLQEHLHVKLQRRARIGNLEIGKHGRMQNTQSTYGDVSRCVGRKGFFDFVEGGRDSWKRRAVIDGCSTSWEVRWICKERHINTYIFPSQKTFDSPSPSTM
jgi:hypothetical protein